MADYLPPEDEFLVIGHDLRTIIIPESKALLGVERDANVNTIYFKGPRYYGPIDLNDFDFQVICFNAEDEGSVYEDGMKTLDIGEENIIYAWTVHEEACLYPGEVRFQVRATHTASGQDDLNRVYHTTVYSLPVLEGLPVVEEGTGD